jgi:hypothetical protein
MRVAGHPDAERLRTLEEVLEWTHARGGSLVDVIVQDEYTHDVVVTLPGVVYLAFDST